MSIYLKSHYYTLPNKFLHITTDLPNLFPPKLAYSNVNVGATRLACAFNAVGFPDSLALVTDAGLTIGGVDAIQKLHVRCVSLGEQPRRIAHQVTTQTFVVLTQKEARTGRDAHFVKVRISHPPRSASLIAHTRLTLSFTYRKLLDARTFEVLDSFALGADENDGAVVSLSFAPDGQGGGSNNGSNKSQSLGHYYVVGTAFTVPEEVEPSRGRLLVFQVANHKLVLVSEKAVKGAVYALSALDGKVLAGINSKVQLFKWVMGGGEGEGGGTSGSIGGTQGTRGTARLPAPAELAGSLIGECSHHGHIVALYVAVKDNLIVVGDLMKSVSLLRYSSEERYACQAFPNYRRLVCLYKALTLFVRKTPKLHNGNRQGFQPELDDERGGFGPRRVFGRGELV